MGAALNLPDTFRQAGKENMAISPVKWGLIGCGDIAGKRVAPALKTLPSSELVAVSSRRPEAAAAFAQTFGVAKHYDHWRTLLQDPEVEAVYIATPVHLHQEQTIAAALAGKHVLCEKPMALCVAEGDRMLDVCSRQPVTFSVAYYRHFYPLIHRMKELIDTGSLGAISLIQINAFSPFQTQPGQPRHWLLQKALSGGGPMMDIGCHRIEVLLHLLGPVAGVKALTTRAVYQDRDVEDTAVAVMEMHSGAIAVLSVTHASLNSRDSLAVFGEHGTMLADPLNQGSLIITTGQGRRVEQHPPHSNLHAPLIDDFSRAIREHREPAFSGKQAREVSRILDLIYEA